MKKLLLLLLIALSAWPTGAQDFVYQGIGYTIIDEDAKTCKTKEGTTSAGGNTLTSETSLILPAHPEKDGEAYTLIEIAKCSFYKQHDLKSITIPETVTTIGDYAFGNTDISFVEIQGNIETVGSQIFFNCTLLTDAVFSEGVTAIPDKVFNGVSALKSVIIPQGITSIGAQAFYQTGLEHIAIPNSVTIIGTWAFGRCESLTSVVICGGEVEIGQYAFNGSTNIQKAAYPETLTENTPSAKLLISTPPNCKIDENGLVFSEDNTTLYFAPASLPASITLPDGVTTIAQNAFRASSGIETIKFPESLTEIETLAFFNCTSLKSITLPKNLSTIGAMAFQYCTGVEDITFEADIKSLGSSVFTHFDSLKKAVFAEGVTSVPASIFSSNTTLEEVKFPSTLKEIGASAFYYCSSLKSVSIPEGTTTIGDRAFQTTDSGLTTDDEPATALTSVVLPSTITSIGSSAFRGQINAAFNALELTDIESIGDYAFYNCNGLESALFGPEMTAIGKGAFMNCSGLSTAIILSTKINEGAETTFENSFSGCVALQKAAYPDVYAQAPFTTGTAVAFPAEGAEAEDGWVYGPGKSAVYFAPITIKDEITLPETVTAIGARAFQKCTGITAITLPEGVTEIGESAFEGCSALTSAVIPDAVKNIGNRAFYLCSNIESISIPASAEVIGDYAYYDIKGLPTAAVLMNATVVGKHAFYNTGLTSVVLGNADVVLGEGAFLNCPLVKSAYPDAMERNPFTRGVAIAYQADDAVVEDGIIYDHEKTLLCFAPVNLAGEFVVPQSVNEIGNNAFESCGELESVVMRDGVATIGDRAFYNCEKLTSLVVSAQLKTVGNYAFYNLENLTTFNLPTGMQKIGDYAFYQCAGMPATINLTELKSIGKYAFYTRGDGVRSVILGSDASDVAAAAFMIPSLKKSAYPNTLESNPFVYIDEANEKTYEYGLAVAYEPEGAIFDADGFIFSPGKEELYFAPYSLEGSYTLPATVKAIGPNAFNACANLAAVVMGENVQTIGFQAFRDCKALTSVEMENSITSMGNGAFYNCDALTSVKLSNTLTSIGNQAFIGCTSLKNINIPQGLTAVGKQAFWRCTSLETLNIPSTITTIGEQAFTNCTGLTSIRIPDSIEEIGEGAWSGCSAIESVEYITADPITASSDIFDSGIYSTAELRVLETAKDAFDATTPWKDFTNRAYSSILLNYTEYELEDGSTLQLEAASGSGGTLTWTTSDETVATVDASGLVTATGVGTATITVTTSRGDHAECAITVVPRVIAVETVVLSRADAKVEAGQTLQLTATVNPEDATDKTLIWTSSNENIATVSDAGLVTAVAPGPATITARATNGVVGRCALTVVEKIIPAETISLNVMESELEQEATLQLRATVTPTNATDKSVVWSSSDETVATVDAYGTVTGVAVGKATITAATSNDLKAECVVNVIAKVIQPAGIVLNTTETRLEEESTLQLTATVSPDNATDKTITWSSSDETVATVDANGLITAVATGSATITATTVNGLTATCALTVVEKRVITEGVLITPPEGRIEEGTTLQLKATVKPDDATDKSVVWSSSDETVATVDANGLVAGVKAGKATIKATTKSGLEATCELTVVAKTILPTAITLNTDKSEIENESTLQLTATVAPDNATDKTVVWSSSAERIAKVDANGLVTALATGRATITAKTTNGLTATCAITVVARTIVAEGIVLNSDKDEMEEGQTLQLTATVAPATTTDKSVAWSSSDEAVAKVSATGLVSAIAPGKATITAKTHNGKSATCVITVVARTIEVESISLNRNEAKILNDETLQLTATITPSTATDKSVAWTSSDEAVATVDANGLVTAVAPGKTTITATASNGLTASCELTVEKRSGINGTDDDASINVCVSDGVIIIEAPEGTVAEVYSLTGMRMVQTREHRIDGLAHGVYVVRVANKAYKVIV